MKISREVYTALDEGRPILAFESTVIAHGLPFPSNIECAIELEGIARSQGVVPATIAIIGGIPKIGVTEEEIKHLAQAGNAEKAGTRDIARIVASEKDGATTVSATARLASTAGIHVFATGGRSVESNVALLKNNAAIGAQIARALSNTSKV